MKKERNAVLFRFLRRITAVFAAFSVLLGAPVVFADTEKEIAYEIAYEEGITHLTLNPAKSSHTVYYTTDGSKPTKSSEKYVSRLSTKKGALIRAAEYDKNGKKVAVLRLELKLRCAAPVLSAEKSGKRFLVSLTSETEGAVIYYTTDGTKPTQSSARYSEPFSVKKGTTVRAYAVKSGEKSSKRVEITVNKEIAAEEKTAEYDALSLDVLKRINDCRAEHGAAPLKMDEDLYRAAKLRADEITVLYSHDRPNGTPCYTILEEVGFSYRTAGENIAWTEGSLSTAEFAVSAWINSKPHFENIVNDAYDVTGIYTRRVGNTTYWVQIFGKRL